MIPYLNNPIYVSIVEVGQLVVEKIFLNLPIYFTTIFSLKNLNRAESAIPKNASLVEICQAI